MPIKIVMNDITKTECDAIVMQPTPLFLGVAVLMVLYIEPLARGSFWSA